MFLIELLTATFVQKFIEFFALSAFSSQGSLVMLYDCATLIF